ncbi:hypothetical protein [Aeromonas veronii]
MTILEYVKENRMMLAVIVVVTGVLAGANRQADNIDPISSSEQVSKNVIDAVLLKEDVDAGYLISENDIEFKKVENLSSSDDSMFITMKDFLSSTKVSSKPLSKGSALKKNDLYKHSDIGYLEYIYAPKDMIPFTLRFTDPDSGKNRSQILDQINYDTAKILQRGDKINIYVNEKNVRDLSSRVLIYNAEVADVSFVGKKTTLILGLKKDDVKLIFENMSKDIYIAKCISGKSCENDVKRALDASKVLEIRG